MAAARSMLAQSLVTQGWNGKCCRDNRNWDDAAHGVILRLFDSLRMRLSQGFKEFHCRMNATYLKPH
jgi:hypothetical protein